MNTNFFQSLIDLQVAGNWEISIAKETEQAKISSQMEKDKALKVDKEKTDNQKKYEKIMIKIDELEAVGKFKEAWIKVPHTEQYPEHAQAISKLNLIHYRRP
jgi:adenylate cyclase class IV